MQSGPERLHAIQKSFYNKFLSSEFRNSNVEIRKMGRKKNKRQRDPAPVNDAASSDDTSQKSCPHVAQSVALNLVRKNIGKSNSLRTCQQCTRLDTSEKNAEDVERRSLDVWLCLRCGNSACGRSSVNKHAEAHYMTPRSDVHALAVNTVVWDVWCYKCDTYLDPKCNQKLTECVEFLKKNQSLFDERNRPLETLSENVYCAAVKPLKSDADCNSKETGSVKMGNHSHSSEKSANINNTLGKEESVKQEERTSVISFPFAGFSVKSESGSSDEGGEEKSCPHVMQSSTISTLRAAVEKLSSLQDCQDCALLKGDKENMSDQDQSETTAWICLKCGHCGCGSYSENKHAKKHFESFTDEAHPLVVNSQNWGVWCYMCDKYLPMSRKLKDVVEFLRTSKSPTNQEPKKKLSKSVYRESRTIQNGSVPVKGLRNLGNTCYMNSVLQSLSRTRYLSELLPEHCAEGLSVELQCTPVEDEAETLPPVQLSLESSGNLTNALRDVIQMMKSSSGLKTVTPQKLREEICRNNKEFQGMEQHDSHELLRHLLDGVKAEEIRRCHSAILKAFKLDIKENRKKLSDEMKKKVAAYGHSKHTTHTIVDAVFGGTLVSTITCEECQTVSRMYEPCLDCSLPISEEQLHVRNPRKKSVDEVSPSTVSTNKNSKKMRRKSKNKRKNFSGSSKHNDSIHDVNVAKCDNSDEEQQSGESKSDADIEDNDAENKPSVGVEDSHVPMEEKTKHHPSSFAAEDNCVTLSKIVVTNSESSLSNGSHDSMSVGCEIDNSSPVRYSDDTETGNLSQKFANMHLQNNDISEDEGHGTCEEDIEVKISSEMKHKGGRLTLAPRYQPSAGECSVLTCLNQFTCGELLTGNNKFGCENCTSIRGRDTCTDGDGTKKTLVRSIASKQLLIYSPPAVLTLQLKRFQQTACGLRKINRHVTFPLVLDLAPYCSSACLNLPTMKTSQSSILYSLYAIVEHSGSLQKGHYTACVKVQTSDEANEVKKSFLNCSPTNTTFLPVNTREASEDMPHISTAGIWYDISDETVRTISEEQVLKKQAYLLFYERVH